MAIKDTLKELHQRLVLQSSSASQKDWLDLLDLYEEQEKLNEDDHKIKTAFYRGYANDLVTYLKKYMPSEPALLHSYITILGRAQKYVTNPHYIRLMKNKLFKKFANDLEFKVIQESSVSVQMESATLVVKDYEIEIPIRKKKYKSSAELINKYKIAIINFDGDMTIKVIVRLVNSKFPLLKRHEYSFTNSATDIMHVSIKSGTVSISDNLLSKRDDDNKFYVSPGEYLVSAYTVTFKKNTNPYCVVVFSSKEEDFDCQEVHGDQLLY